MSRSAHADTTLSVIALRPLPTRVALRYQALMTDASAHRHHTIDYIEISARDLPAAKVFYAAAFGWTFTDYGPTYAGIVGEGREMGGLAEGEPTGRGGCLVVLYSEDLEASLEAVRSAGGTIVKEIFSFPGGRRFHFADPSGNELAVWTTR